MRGTLLRLAGLASCGAVLLGLPGAASAQAPAVVAWWSSSNVGAAAAPSPPDVQRGDLFVQGSNAGGAPVSGLPVSSAQAVSALSFAFPAGSTVGPLILKLDPKATAPPSSSVTACRVTAAFTAVENGPYADVPAYDGTGCVPSELSADGTTLSFPKIASLVGATGLSVLLVPGPLDRVVLAPPTAAVLTVTPPAQNPPAQSPPALGAPPAAISSGASSGGFAGDSGSGFGGPAFGGRDAVLVPPLAPAAAEPVIPQTAAVPPPPNPAAAVPVAAPATKVARIAAGIGLVLLLGWSLYALRGGLSPAVAPGLLRRPVDSDEPVQQGVGRFRAVRTGRSPGLS